MIYGFGSRPVTNPVVVSFLKSIKHIYYPCAKNVEPFQVTNWPAFNRTKWLEEKIPIAILGILRGTEQLLWFAKENNINYYYIDHAYFFRADKHVKNKETQQRSYRVCLNNENLNFLVNNKLNNDDRVRINKNKNLLFPRNIVNATGNKILICPPSEAISRYYKFQNGVDGWLNETLKIVKQQTDKEIVIRYKDTKIPFIKDFENAYCIITYQSTIAIEAVLRGIPSFCHTSSSVAPVSNTTLNLNQLIKPTYQQIEDWVEGLLVNQFTMEELQSGIALNTVNRIQAEKYIQ